MTERLRLALFGAGNIGERHLRLAAAHNQCAVVAVADPSDHSKKLAKEFSAQHFSDFKALLAEAKVDGAIIATPNDLHASIDSCLRRVRRDSHSLELDFAVHVLL